MWKGATWRKLLSNLLHYIFNNFPFLFVIIERFDIGEQRGYTPCQPRHEVYFYQLLKLIVLEAQYNTRLKDFMKGTYLSPN